jgi:hypothetical protein
MKISKFKIGVSLLAVGSLILFAYVVFAFYIKNIGIELNTDKNLDYSQEVEYFLQNDPIWANQKLGNSSYTLAKQGCTVTAVAMILRFFGNDEINPGILNKELIKNEAYTKNGQLLWYKLEEIYPVEYSFRRVFSAGTLEKDLQKGILPIVRVKYGGKELEHWVLVVGADGKDFLIMDPLNKNETLTRLGEYGKVYAYRVIVPRGY